MANYNSTRTGDGHDGDDARIAALETKNLDSRITILENQTLNARIASLETQVQTLTSQLNELIPKSKKIIDLSKLLYEGRPSNGYTATQDCYFYALVITGQSYPITLNNTAIQISDNSGNIWTNVANGFMTTGDVIKTGGVVRVYGLK